MGLFYLEGVQYQSGLKSHLKLQVLGSNPPLLRKIDMIRKGEYKQGILKGDCTIDLLFDLFGLACFANKNKKLSVIIQLIPNQSNRRSTVQ